MSADSDAGPAPSITSATTAECRTICPALIAPLYSHDVRRLSIGLATLVVAHAPATIGSDASTIRQVAVAGQAAPGGGSFEHFSIEWLPVVAPVNDRGQVAFFATLLRSAASEGIFLASGSSITKIAVDGDRAPGGGTLSGFGKHPIPALNAHGSVAFAAAVAGGTTVEGIFLSSRGRLRSVAVAGGPAPGIASGTFAVLDAPALNERDYVAFLASVRRGREQVEAIYLRAGRALTKVVAQGDPAPAGGTFAGFGPPALNGQGTVAFAAVVEGRAAPGGVFVADTSGVRMLVGAGDESPLGGIYAKFSERIALNDAGMVAFTAVLKGARVAQAVMLVEADRVRVVSALDEPAPEGGTFSHFGPWPSLGRAGAVGFTASVDRAAVGVAAFVVDRGRASRAVALGDALPAGGRLTSFGLYPAISLSPGGAVTFTSAPTATGEGVEGLFVIAPAPR